MGVKRIPVGGVQPINFFRDGGWRKLNYDIALVAQNPRGVRSAGFTQQNLGNCRVLGLGALANAVAEVVEWQVTSFTNYVNNDASKGFGVFSLPFYYSMVMNCYTVAGVTSGERFMGIEWGSFQTLTPWQTNYSIAVNGGVIQFRWNFVTSHWEVLIWDGDNAVAPDIIQTTLNPFFSPDLFIAEIALDYTPAVNGSGSILIALHEGVPILVLTDHPRVNLMTHAGDAYSAGYFITNGDGAGAGCPDAVFLDNRIYQERPRLPV